MNLIEIGRSLRQLRLSGMADVLETRLVQAQTEKLVHLDFLSVLVGDELLRRQDRLLARRLKDAAFRDPGRTLDSFDFDFNKKMNRPLVYELATARFVAAREDVLFLGPDQGLPATAIAGGVLGGDTRPALSTAVTSIAYSAPAISPVSSAGLERTGRRSGAPPPGAVGRRRASKNARSGSGPGVNVSAMPPVAVDA